MVKTYQKLKKTTNPLSKFSFKGPDCSFWDGKTRSHGTIVVSTVELVSELSDIRSLLASVKWLFDSGSSITDP